MQAQNLDRFVHRLARLRCLGATHKCANVLISCAMTALAGAVTGPVCLAARLLTNWGPRPACRDDDLKCSNIVQVGHLVKETAQQCSYSLGRCVQSIKTLFVVFIAYAT